MSRPVDLPDLDDLVARYRAGESLQRLSLERRISRGALKRAFLGVGVTIRGRDGTAVRAALASMSDEDRERLADSYRRGAITRTGRTHSLNRRERMAEGRAKVTRWITVEERALASALVDLSEPAPVPQGAVGPYNVDLLIAPNIAVEVQRMDTADSGKARRKGIKRLEDLLSRGHVIYVFWHATRLPLDVARVAEQMVAHLDALRRQPAPPGQYRVLWGDGKHLSRGDHDLDELARIWPTGSAQRLRSRDT